MRSPVSGTLLRNAFFRFRPLVAGIEPSAAYQIYRAADSAAEKHCLALRREIAPQSLFPSPSLGAVFDSREAHQPTWLE
jgi:hypothetical protein